MELFFTVLFFLRIQPLVSFVFIPSLNSLKDKSDRPTLQLRYPSTFQLLFFFFVPHQTIMLVHPASCLSLLAFIFFSCSTPNLNNIFLLCLLCENKVHFYSFPYIYWSWDPKRIQQKLSLFLPYKRTLFLPLTGQVSKYSVWEYPIEERYTDMYDRMVKWGLAADTEAALKKIKQKDKPWAAFLETPFIKYLKGQDCSLYNVGEVLSSRPYGIVLKNKSPLTRQMNLMWVLKLLIFVSFKYQRRELKKLRKWSSVWIGRTCDVASSKSSIKSTQFHLHTFLTSKNNRFTCVLNLSFLPF